MEGKSSDEFISLAAAYDVRYGKRPQRLAALGYDAVRLITQAVKLGISRDIIVEKLQTIQNYNGASGLISFGDYRENIEMPLYKIINEQHRSLEAEEVIEN